MPDEQIKMVLPCRCPHCQEEIVVAINMPVPLIDIATAEDYSDVLDGQPTIEQSYDTPEEPETV